MESTWYVRVRVAVVAAFMVVVPLVAVTGVRVRGPWWGTIGQFDETASISVSHPSRPRVTHDEVSGQTAASPLLGPAALIDDPLQPVKLDAGNTQGASRIDQIQAELKELGAIYLLLDATKSGARHYRYCCDVPTNSQHKVLRFEAFHANPLGAMERVLEQVRAYLRGSRSPDAAQ